MSYYASGYGELFLKDENNVNDDFIEKLNAECSELLFERSYVKGAISVSFDDGYLEEDMYSDLLCIKDYFKNGHIDFRGEDYCFWRFSLVDEKWIEYGGEVVYSDKGCEIAL